MNGATIKADFLREAHFAGAQAALIEAIERGDPAVARTPDLVHLLNSPTAQGILPLSYFVAKDEPAAIILALKLGADPMRYVEDRGTPLTLAARTSTAALTAFLNAGCDPNARLDRPLIQTAGTASHYANVRLLAARGANINAQADNGDTLLLMALFQGDLELAALALDLGAQPRIANRFGVLPETVAADLVANAKSNPKGAGTAERDTALRQIAAKLGLQ